MRMISLRSCAEVRGNEDRSDRRRPRSGAQISAAAKGSVFARRSGRARIDQHARARRHGAAARRDRRTGQLQPEKTIELALRLHPSVRRVVVITGTSEFDRAWEASLRRAFRPLEGRAEFDFWVAMPLAEILERVRRLPTDSIVYLPGFRQDGTGERLVPQEVATQILSISPVPVYGNASNFREVGTMGGYIAPIEGAAMGNRQRRSRRHVQLLVAGERRCESVPSAGQSGAGAVC